MVRRFTIRVIVGLFLVFIYSCNNNNKVNCDECSENFENIELKLFFSINYKYPKVIFYLYEGNVDNGKLIYSDTTNLKQYNIKVKKSKYFSVKALYVGIKGDSIKVINGTRVSIKNYSDYCENEDCWMVSNNCINAKF